MNKTQVEFKNIISTNPGATLYDIGDDMTFLDFHSHKEAIGFDMISMIQTSIDKVSTNYKGLVLGNRRGSNFCVGANLKLILNAIENKRWSEIEKFIGEFQSTLAGIKKSSFPVISIPFGLTLGGGLEMVYPSDLSVTVAGTYCGLVEVKAGLIPAGGGCKEMLIKTLPNLQNKTGLIEKPIDVKHIFATLVLGKVSRNAHEAKDLGYLNVSDIVIGSEGIIDFAKQKILELSSNSYSPRNNIDIPVLGSKVRETLINEIPSIFGSNQPTEYDIEIASKLAYIITGGNGNPGKLESEQYFLDLEKEIVLYLCGNEKTAKRMSHILVTGKPLRN